MIIKCPSCGLEIEDNRSYCPHCGNGRKMNTEQQTEFKLEEHGCCSSCCGWPLLVLLLIIIILSLI